MTNKIPPSLLWLIDKRARLSGEIIKLKRRLEQVEPLINQLRDLEISLKSIDNSLKLHDIQIDLENIKPISTQQPKKHRFRPGVPRKLVLNFLKSKYGQGTQSRTDICLFLLQEHQKIAPGEVQPEVEINMLTSRLLSRMAAQNYIIRHHPKVTKKDGLWEINPELISHKGG